MADKFYIGQEITESQTFDSEAVRKFAEISGDKNPLHLDEEYGRHSRFGGNIVHGILVTGLISRMIGMTLPGEGSIYLEQNVQFRKPVYVGETVEARVRIADIVQDKNLYVLETNVYNKDGECVIKGNAKVLYEG